MNEAQPSRACVDSKKSSNLGSFRFPWLGVSGVKLARRPLGLLINFNVPILKDGVPRVAAADLFKTEKPTRTDSAYLAPSSLPPCLSGKKTKIQITP